MSLRRLLTLLLAMLLCALLPAHAGTTYTFAGKKIDDCTLDKKVYTCTRLPLSAWDDAMVIARDYTVNVSGDVAFGYNQGLSINGGILAASGNLDIGGIAPSLLQVNGAGLAAGKQFSMGAQQQTIGADISAASMQLGTGSTTKITGTIKATGAIAIGSNATIVGPVSGTTISTNSPVSITGEIRASTSLFLASSSTVKGNITSPVVDTQSPVTITGDVTASRSFTLASGSTMTGNVKSDVVQLLAAGVVVNGSIEATTSLSLGSSDVVNGNVSTGELTLDASDSRIVGNATVDHATLQWATRVTDTITCRQGSTPGKCDCVTNNSGYAVRNVKTSGNGPWCEGAKPQAPHHFVIGHDASAAVCAAPSVTVTACADAACTTRYAAGTTAYLMPGKQQVVIDKSGSATAKMQLPPGTVTLGLVDAGGSALAANCRLNGSNAASNCTVQVNDDATFSLAVGTNNAFTAGDDESQVDLTVKALVYNAAKSACIPLFQDVTRKVAFTATYVDPNTGTKSIKINGAGPESGNTVVATLKFDGNGVATPPPKLSYPDAGQIRIGATYAGDGKETQATGSVLAIAAPASFDVKLADLPKPLKAGSPFKVTVTAFNGAKAITPNFGMEMQPVLVQLAGTLCKPASGANGFQTRPSPSRIAAGVQEFAPQAGDAKPLPRMDEVGSIDVAASLGTDGYLGSGLKPTGSTNTGTSSCTGASGAFIPASFKIDLDANWERKARLPNQADPVRQYYADERAIGLTVTALDLGGATTKNYAGAFARDADLTGVPFDAAGKALPVDYGRFVLTRPACASGYAGAGKAVAVICAEDYQAGVAALGSAKLLPGYAFGVNPSAPARVTLDVTDVTDKVSSDAAGEPVILVRSGRVRIASNYIGAGKELALPVSLDYWDGRAWIRNVDDSSTAFPSTAFALSTPTAGSALNNTTLTGPGKLKNGYGELRLAPPAGVAGVAYVALNLGSAAQDNSCAAPKKNSAGLAMPFLRAPDAACKDSVPHDPWGRATFGVYTPETRRLIHVREVFR